MQLASLCQTSLEHQQMNLSLYPPVLNWWPFCSSQHERLHLATGCAGLTPGKQGRSQPLWKWLCHPTSAPPPLCGSKKMTKIRKVWHLLYQMRCEASRDFLHPVVPSGSLHWTLLTLWLGHSPPQLGSAKGQVGHLLTTPHWAWSRHGSSCCLSQTSRDKDSPTAAQAWLYELCRVKMRGGHSRTQ